jgi:hypothetical protein
MFEVVVLLLVMVGILEVVVVVGVVVALTLLWGKKLMNGSFMNERNPQPLYKICGNVTMACDKGLCSVQTFCCGLFFLQNEEPDEEALEMCLVISVSNEILE